MLARATPAELARISRVRAEFRGHGDHSRLSCSAGDTQLGTGFCRDLQQAFCTDVGHHAASPRRHELAAIFFDQKMIGRRQASNTIAQFALDFARKESVCGDHGRRA
jgi:hypothetical protein